MSESEKIREKIIGAAVERFLHYGYPKTTIAELAGDCAMSPGNIYRFFKGKIDIAAEIARREALQAVERMEAVLECPYRSSRQRLEEVVFADMRHTFHLLENEPRVLELAQVVVQERPQFQIESLRRERRIFLRRLGRCTVSVFQLRRSDVAQEAKVLQIETDVFRHARRRGTLVRGWIRPSHGGHLIHRQQRPSAPAQPTLEGDG